MRVRDDMFNLVVCVGSISGRQRRVRVIGIVERWFSVRVIAYSWVEQ